jgi:hypothetical protein
MQKISLDAFWEEVEKLSYGPQIVEHPFMGTPGMPVAAQLPGRLSETRNPALGLTPGRDAILLPTKEKLLEISGGNSDFADMNRKSMRRHELKHWMNDSTGRFPRSRGQGVRGVLSSLADEATAYASGSRPYLRAMVNKTLPDNVRHAAAVTLGGQWGQDLPFSMRNIYPEGVGKALMGGTLGRAVGRIRKLVGR